MRLADFERLVRRLTDQVPPDFLDGVVEIAVSPRVVPHPVRGDIWTLGECIPLHDTEGEGGIVSRVVLYHGSFRALAADDPDFDWREEAWETLTHELRHHLEWRARAPELERLDDAAEANYARHDGEPFPSDFHLDGERVAGDVYRIELDYFLDRPVRAVPPEIELGWHGRRYRVPVPPEATLPAFLTVEDVADPPPGELVLVLRRRPGLRDLLRRGPPAPPFQAAVRAVKVPGPD
ncbi:MAG TPA: metallopeptidase family protein [Gemmatimonadales bacterium]|nr:metallopeptidase family protein [Gemmatimonadales bacterium]